jgi:uncharacterized membrane protein YkvA (DUF1232 family)
VSWWQWLLVAVLVTALIDAAFVAWLVRAGRHEDAQALARFIPDCVVLFRRILREPRVPRHSKVLLAVLIGYLASPIDLVPDFIPVAGHLDDAIIVALALRSILRATGRELLEEHWPGPEASLNVLIRLAYGRSPGAAGRGPGD